MRIAALGAGAGDVAVCQEGFGFLVIVLLALLGDEFVVVVELAEELRGIFLVHLGGGAGVDVVVDAQAREGIFHYLMVLVHNILRSYALFAGLDGDGHAVFVAAADEHHILPAHAQVADIDVSGNVSAGQVADMDGTVGVGKCAGHKGSFVTHFFILPSLILMVFLISFSLFSWFSRDTMSACERSGEPSFCLSSCCWALMRLSWYTRMALGT